MMKRTASVLTKMYKALCERFGPQGWWPSAAGADTPEGKLEICVGAILTQNTAWPNVRPTSFSCYATCCAPDTTTATNLRQIRNGMAMDRWYNQQTADNGPLIIRE